MAKSPIYHEKRHHPGDISAIMAEIIINNMLISLSP
jgi:hypothetical protein